MLSTSIRRCHKPPLYTVDGSSSRSRKQKDPDDKDFTHLRLVPPEVWYSNSWDDFSEVGNLRIRFDVKAEKPEESYAFRDLLFLPIEIDPNNVDVQLYGLVVTPSDSYNIYQRVGFGKAAIGTNRFDAWRWHTRLCDDRLRCSTKII